MLNKFKQKLKNRKPMEPKRKALVKGLVFGFLAGGLATITAVGIVGCSMTQGDRKEPQSRKLVFDVDDDLTNSTWTLNTRLYDFDDCYAEIDFVSNGVEFNEIYGIYDDDAMYYGGSVDNIYPYDNNSWVMPLYRTINIVGGSYVTDQSFITWLNNNAVYDGPYAPVTSSSEATTSSALTTSETTTSSAATTSEPVATSSEDATISAPSSTSRVERGSITLGDRNPFSAWVVNPKSLDRATSFDGGAPWLLYTGSPTDDNSNHSTIETKYETYSLGAFHVYGNDGVTFDKIGITTQNLSVDNVLTLDGETATQVSAAMYEKGAFRVTGIKYVNSVSNTSVDVYKEVWSVVDMSGNSVYALNGGRWLNEGFRTIVLDDLGGSLTINGYRASVGWWLENNALASSDAIATMVLGNSSTGVFGLIASAFGCWTSIFGLAIIPGLTIGTLIFVPLVVMIIVAIVKLLAK